MVWMQHHAEANNSTVEMCYQQSAIINDSIGAFKPCRIHRIYELNSHERHYKVIITTGKLDIFFKHRVSELWVCQ